MEAPSHWRKGARVFKSPSADRNKIVKVRFSFGLCCTLSVNFFAWHCLGRALQGTAGAQAVHEQAGVTGEAKSSCK